MRGLSFHRWHDRCVLIFAGMLAVTLAATASTHAQTLVDAGTSTVIPIAGSLTPPCVEESSLGAGSITATTDCDLDLSHPQQILIFAASGLANPLDPETEFFGQTVFTIGTLVNEIEIPVPLTAPFQNALLVQVATEVAWNGGLVTAGLDSTFVQVIATLQIRDVTDATETDPGPVVASNTFLFERLDADFEIDIPDGPEDILEFLNVIDFIEIAASTGADVTALLERGRIYSIEVEAKCDIGVPILGFGLCTFTDAALAFLPVDSPLAPLIEGDGFAVSDITVTVASDPVQILSN